MSDPRDIPMADIDWQTILHDMGRSARPLWRLSRHDPNRTPEDYGNGCWSGLTLGEVADKGEREIRRHNGVGPTTIARLREIIDMARAGTLPLKGGPAPDSLWPSDREENGRFSGGSGDYREGIQEGWKAGEAQERRIWEEAVKLSLGTIPEGLRNALEQVRAGVEGE